jgi:hypothetical protein
MPLMMGGGTSGGVIGTLPASLLLCLTLATGAQALCPDGRWLIDDGPIVIGEAALPVGALLIRGDHVALGDGCVADRVRIRRTPRGIRFRARWESCDGLPGPIRVRGAIRRGCARLRGALAARGAHLRTRFTATSGSSCGTIVGIPCLAGEFCELPPATCATADLPGTCTSVPEACSDLWEPVRGCDGVTYGNDCERQAARAQVAHVGPCERVCDTVLGLPCDGDAFCEHPAGACAVADVGGICVPPPAECPEHLAPVCGCDGLTYPNDCERVAARIQKDNDGACACAPLACPPGAEPYDGTGDGCPDRCLPVPCTTNADCLGGEWCAKHPGACGGSGVCRAHNFLCTLHFDPVCGCDGRTYGNDCEAAQAGATVAHDGPCETLCDTILGLPCPDGSHCEHPTGTCETADGGGTCHPGPAHGPEISAPVCGCDGVTYRTDGARRAARAQHAVDGACPTPCHGGDGCADGQLCETPPGECDGAGSCAPRPDACLTVIEPVCGCDGHVYGNACEAAAAGVAVGPWTPCIDRH